MAHTMHLGTVPSTSLKAQKTYTVNVKGLIKHLLDVLFVSAPANSHYHVGELSAHLQRDLGLSR